jgi:hypothetical protein
VAIVCLGQDSQRTNLIPILHTAWLNNHALILKEILQNIILVRNLLLIKENLSQTHILFNFNALTGTGGAVPALVAHCVKGLLPR